MKSTQKTSCIVPVDEIQLVTRQHLHNIDSQKMLLVEKGLVRKIRLIVFFKK